MTDKKNNNQMDGPHTNPVNKDTILLFFRWSVFPY